MAKRKPEDVLPLDGGQPPQEKKTRKEAKYADQIMIKYEPANSKEKDTGLASYYALKVNCEHGFFESDKIPDPPEMKITCEVPFASLPAFLEVTMGIDYSSLTVITVDGKCYSTGATGSACEGKNAACNALTILPWAIYFGHTQMIKTLRGIVLDVVTKTDEYEDEPLFENSTETCMQALLHLAQQMGHGRDYYDLLGALTCSDEVKKYIRDPKMTSRYGQVFRAMQMTDWANAPPEIRENFLCPFCNKLQELWSRGCYAKIILESTDKTPDWKAIREAKIKSITSCKDHPYRD